ncbi:transporter substrate-binding domain-containing protein, partial [Thermodesulfobacteriota bacterium]
MSQKAIWNFLHPFKSLKMIVVAVIVIQTQLLCHSSAATTVKVGIYQNEPKVYLDKQGKPAGFFPELLNFIAEKEDWVLEYVPCIWNECLEKVESGELDLMMDVAFSESRAKRFSFSREVVLGNWSRVYTRDTIAIGSILDLDGKKIAVVKGSFQARKLKADARTFNILPTFIEVETFAMVFDLIEKGEADAGIVNRLYGAQQMKNFGLQETGVVLYPSQLMFVAPKIRDDKLLRGIDKHLVELKKDQRSIYHSALEQALAPVKKPISPALPLTVEELAWLAAHPEIKIAINQAWPPMDYIDEQGKPQGIGVGFIKALNSRLSGRLKIVPLPWMEMYEGVKEKRIDALMDITPRPDRDPFFNFTKPYVMVPHIIIAPKDAPYYENLSHLEGKTVGVERGFFIVRVLREKYPTITVKLFNTTSDALDAVSKGETDAYIGNRAVAMYIVEKELIANLKGHGKVEETASINAIGVRKDWHILREILQKALDNLNRNEISAILKKWADLDEDGAAVTIQLNPEEKAWLSDHPVIRVAPDANWAPVEFIDDNGEFKGVSVDYLKRMSSMLGIELQFIKDVSFKETVAKLRNRELDIFSTAIETPERKAFATFTKPYLSLPTAVFTLDDSLYINSLVELAGRKVAVVQGYAVTEFIKREYPQIKVVEVRNIPEALRKLQSKQVFAYVGTILITGHYIHKEGYTNLKISGQTDFKLEIAMAARSDWPILAGLLQKAMDAIDEEERSAIFKKWIAVTFEKRVDYSLIYKVVLGALSLLAVFLLWNRSLAREVAERKRAEEIIGESEERLNLVLKGGDLGLWDVNFQTGETIFNERWAEMLEYSLDELEQTRETWMNSIHPDDRERILKVGQDYREGRIPDYEVEYRAVTKQTDIIWQVSKGAIVAWDEHGSPIRMVGTAMDITERKRAEEEIKNSEQRLAQIINFLPDATFVIDRQSKVIAWNKAIEELTGISTDDILGKGNYEYSLPFRGERHPLLIDLVFRRDEEVEKRYLKFRKEGEVLFAESYNPILRPDGVYLSSSARPLYDARGQVMGAIQAIRDVTERKRIEESLRESEENYRLLVKNLPSIVYKGFRDWSVNLYDNKIELMTGYTMHEFNSGIVKWAELVVEEDIKYAKHKFIEALKSDKSYIREYRIKTRSDNILWIQERGQIVCDDSGEIEYIDGVLFDITERKQMEAELF